MIYKLAADSSANLVCLPGVDYSRVPMKIITGAAEYVDSPELDVESMVAEVKVTKGKSGTSCPNVHDWLRAFEGADRVFAVTITSNLSGSFSSARQAAEDYEEDHPGARVCVIDSLSAGPELGLILEKLAQWIGEGREFDWMVQGIRDYMRHTHLAFTLESLTNLARNGRVNPAIAKIAGVLGIRVMGIASEQGTLQDLHKCRGEKKALETLWDEMKNRGYQGGKVRISHCFNEAAAETLRDMIFTDHPGAEVCIEPCSALCSFYAERGGLLVGYEDGNL